MIGNDKVISIREVNQRDRRAIFSWIRTEGKSVMDLWEEIVPIIKNSVGKEFSDENPNQWSALKPSYAAWKIKKGYPSTIGVRTGVLKSSAIEEAIITKKPSFLRYEVNMEMTKTRGKQPYAFWFNKRRPLFLYSEKYVNQVIDTAVEDYLSKKIQKFDLSNFRKR